MVASAIVTYLILSLERWGFRPVELVIGGLVAVIALCYLIELFIARGADVNARANVDEAGVGGQTAIFHAATQFGDDGLPIVRLLVERGADLSVRAKLPGHYEQPDEVIDCTPLGYAMRFQQESQPRGATVAFLQERGAPL